MTDPNGALTRSTSTSEKVCPTPDLCVGDQQGPGRHAWNESLDLTSSDSTAWQCHCWTNCTSNGKKWTKMYFVGSFGSLATCHMKAKVKCHKLANDYDYANAGCGNHP